MDDEETVIDICSACGIKRRVRLLECESEDGTEIELPVCKRCYKEMIENDQD
jgi:hypothetical protein